MNELHLFAGAGGGVLGGQLLGHTCVCAVEIEPYCREVLLQRQRDGMLPKFPIWDDVRTFDGRDWRGLVDVVCGGFPCQDISCAGKGAGLAGVRSGLWSEFARIIREVRPRYAFVENSPMLTSRGLGRVLGDLSEMGYDEAWCVLGADDVGAPHTRKRLWLLAKAQNADASCERRKRTASKLESIAFAQGKIWREDTFYALLDFEKLQYEVKSEDERMDNGIPHFMDRFKAIGNGQVPIVDATAFKILTQTLEGKTL